MARSDLILLHAPSLWDFRKRATLWGPISDLVPSTPLFDMYPIGYSSMTAHLEEAGFRVSIVNLAARMIRSPRFEPEAFLGGLETRAFGIDLHWLPHADGALSLLEILKRLHPHKPVILGGYSASYYRDELMNTTAVDYVLRGDSTEIPLARLLDLLRATPEGEPPGDAELAQVPNLTWRSRDGSVRTNEKMHIPDSLDHLDLSHLHMVRAVAREANLRDRLPFARWTRYPVKAALSVRGCTRNCAFCGGSAYAARHVSGRKKPAFRSPKQLAHDIRKMQHISHGPVFIVGDIRQAGSAYTDEFLEAIRGYRGKLIFETFDAIDEAFARKLGESVPGFVMEFSPESHDPAIRQAINKHYSNEEIGQTIEACLKAGCKRFDIFFIIGLPHQTQQSVLESIDYCCELLRRFPDRRLIPFIGPLAPFIDPGSPFFEEPERFGYHIHCRTLAEHRESLRAPTWKHLLSYDTDWMSRNEIAEVTYEAGRRLTRAKAEAGLIKPRVATATLNRIDRAVSLMGRIDELIATVPPEDLDAQLLALKPQIDTANMSTVCEKSELDLVSSLLHLRPRHTLKLVVEGLKQRFMPA